MSLESATHISDLDPTNPLSTDTKSQGDDHIRMIKDVLKRDFPGASKAFYNPSAAVKSANYNVVAADMNKTLIADTSGGSFNFVLPTLVLGDAGWECSLLKVGSDLNPYFIIPPSGNLLSGEYTTAKARRCIPGRRCRALWTGTVWLVDRAVSLPIGSVIDNPLPTLPVGFEEASGQNLVLAAVNYPEYFALFANMLPDRRGLLATGRDSPSVGRLTVAGSGIDGTVIGSNGGIENRAISLANLPNITLTGTITGPWGSHTHDVKYTTVHTNVAFGTGSNDLVVSVGSSGPLTGLAAATATTFPTTNVSVPVGGSGTVFPLVQPTIVSRMIVVVE